MKRGPAQEEAAKDSEERDVAVFLPLSEGIEHNYMRPIYAFFAEELLYRDGR